MAAANRTLRIATLVLAMALAGGAALAADADSGPAADAHPAFTLLRRAVADPWAVDRALALPLPSAAVRDDAAVPFRLMIEAQGATHSAVVMPRAPTPGRSLRRDAPPEALSAGGAVCLIRRGGDGEDAQAWAAEIATARAPTLAAPDPHAALGATLVVRGEATGPWFAEAAFPVRLLGPNGGVLAATSAVAQGDWMSEAYVPFRAELHLAGSPPGRALLVLERANPSGLPGNAGYLMVRLGCG